MNIDDKEQLESYSTLAVELAQRGAAMAFDSLGHVGTTESKPDGSVLTEADTRVQDMVVQRLRRDAPQHGVLAEETSSLLNDDDRRREFVWIVDPIDGTRNFATGVPLFACSIALMHRGSPIVAAVAIPSPKMVCWTHIAGLVRLNNTVVHVSDRSFGDDCVLAMSASQQDRVPGYLQRWVGRRLLRDFGSAAWHMVMVACGMIEAAVLLKVKLWDVAAGALLVTQAGGRVLALNDNGQPTDAPFWPMDLAEYRNQTVPLLACSKTIADPLITEMMKYAG